MFFAGIDIGGTAVKLGVLCDEKGKLVYTTRKETGRLSPEDMAAAIAELYFEAEEAIQKQYGSPISGVGAVCAGHVHPESGLVTAGNLQWLKVPFGALLREKLGVPVALDNDVQGALYGEWKYGICRGVQNVVYVTLGTGIGGAFLINGATYRGENNEGAEIGHLVTHADGESCSCGGRGCWEVYASAVALSRYAGGAQPKEIFTKAAAGDEQMRGALKRYVHELNIGLSSLHSMLRPDMIVLGGGLSEAGKALLGPVTEELNANSPSIPLGKPANVQLASLGNQAGMLGAALIAMDRSGAR